MDEMSLVDQMQQINRIVNDSYGCFERMRESEDKIKKIRLKVPVVAITVIMIGASFFWIGTYKGIFFLVSAIFIIPGIFGIRKSESEKKAKMDEEQKHADQYRDQGNKLVNDNIHILSILPQNYWYPMAVDYMTEMVVTKRAASINEAMDMFDEQLHRWRMENMQSQILRNQEHQTSMLGNIQVTSAVSAAASVARLFR